MALEKVFSNPLVRVTWKINIRTKQGTLLRVCLYICFCLPQLFSKSRYNSSMWIQSIKNFKLRNNYRFVESFKTMYKESHVPFIQFHPMVVSCRTRYDIETRKLTLGQSTELIQILHAVICACVNSMQFYHIQLDSSTHHHN